MHPAEIRKKRDKTPDEALAALMRLCARAEKSEGDARRLMRGWGVSQADRPAMGERLAQQLERKARTVKYTSQYELKTRLIRYGLSLGYDYEAVMDAASAMVRETDTCNDF